MPEQNKLYDFVLSFLKKIAFDNDELHGFFRLMFFAAMPILWALFSSFFFRMPDSTFLYLVHLLRYFSIPLVSIFVTLILGALYIQDIYELKSLRESFNYIWKTFFVTMLPVINIPKEVDSVKSDNDQLRVIGGPGYLDVQPGNIVVLEELTKPSDVLGAGKREINRFQTIKEVFSLKEKSGAIDEVSVITKDGIKVSIHDINYRFRFLSINDGNVSERLKSNPYPFSTRAAVDLAYKRAVGPSGEPPHWESSVKGVVSSTITSFLKRTSLDALTSSAYDKKAPLEEIFDDLNSPHTRDRLKKIGAELLWCEVGKLDFGKLDADAHRMRKWAAEWDGREQLIQAQGDAEFLANQERGRAEGQVNLLQSVSHALRDANRGDDSSLKKDENLRKIVLARTAQVIEAMTSIYEQQSKKKGKNDEQ